MPPITIRAILAKVDRRFFGDEREAPLPEEAIEAFLPYVAAHLAAGGRLNAVTRHILGLFHGRPGARIWRRILTLDSVREGAGTEVIAKALSAVRPASLDAAE